MQFLHDPFCHGITHKNSSLDCTNSNLQVWYKLMQDSWCNICFFNFNSYSFASMLFLPNLDIKSFNDSQIIHLANSNPLFHTSTLRWCFFLNLLIVDWKIPLMLKSLLIYMYIIMKLKKKLYSDLFTIFYFITLLSKIFPHIR
jgi:hypothetical protein